MWTLSFVDQKVSSKLRELRNASPRDVEGKVARQRLSVLQLAREFGTLAQA